MRKLIAIAFMLTVTAPLSAIAYTQEDVAACTPDAFRLCQQAFPDKSLVLQCLAKNRRQLNPACTLAFNRGRAEMAAAERPSRCPADQIPDARLKWPCRQRDRFLSGPPLARSGQNALKVMIVRVSWMPGMTWIFSLTKWPMSTPVST